ncbi:hypothetical protein [Corynebacterium tuberculostearicum]|uniref:hypothetical protein n=1 Tax=Corynebacterium tuberculostearicum TaxID=38304 RepID=UPI00195667FE|nr:hypothetical protein [Corynebacterium tuberculostearicum]QRQ67159.1 hypothetical protein I6J28_11555 [Corynebacterium tuberculostearicum]
MDRIAHVDNAEFSAREAVKLSYLSRQSLENQPPKAFLMNTRFSSEFLRFSYLYFSQPS